MTLSVFNRIGQMLAVLCVQILVLNHIHLWGYATPLLCFAFVLLAPLRANRILEMIMAFVLGLVVDMFSTTPGVCAGAMVLASFVQHDLLAMMAPKDSEQGLKPSAKELGRYLFIVYLALIQAIGLIAYFVLDIFSFSQSSDLLLTLACSYASSIFVTLIFVGLNGRL